MSSLQRPGLRLQKTAESRSCSSSLVIDIFFVLRRLIPMVQSVQVFGGRYPSYAGRAVSQVLSWRRHSCSHSCISLRNCRGLPQLQFITVVGTPFVAQMLIPMVRVDRAVDAPVMQVVQFRSSSIAPCI